MSSKLELEYIYLQTSDQIKSLAYFCVSESKQSIQSRLLDSKAPIILELDKKKGDYWIFEAEESAFYLLPKYNFRVNEFSYQTLKAVFNCIGYQPTQTNFWSLVSSATVHPINEEKTEWIVTELGEIAFSTEELQIATLASKNQGEYANNSEFQTNANHGNQIDINQAVYLESSDELNRLREENTELRKKIASYEILFLDLKKFINDVASNLEPPAMRSYDDGSC